MTRLDRGRAGTMADDSKRHGNTDLFATVNVGTGEIVYGLRKGNTATDALASFIFIDLHVPWHLAIQSCSTTLLTRTPRLPTGSTARCESAGPSVLVRRLSSSAASSVFSW